MKMKPFMSFLSSCLVGLLLACTSLTFVINISAASYEQSQAAESGDFVVYDKQRALLAEIQADVELLQKFLQPGEFFSDRLHASNATQVKVIANKIQTHLTTLFHQASNNLRLHRRGSGSTETIEWIQQRGLLELLNPLIEHLKNVKVVFDHEGMLGSFGTAVDLFSLELPTLDVNGFDYTRGFTFDCKSIWKSGLVVHRNKRTGAITWHSAWKSGIAITGENADGSPIVARQWKTGISSAYDAYSEKWEVFSGAYKTPSASVFNAVSQKVESRLSGWKSGMAGVYNPQLQKVEWQWGYEYGVAGYYDSHANAVVWRTAYKSGVACIWRDDNGDFHTSSGFGSDFGDDEE